MKEIDLKALNQEIEEFVRERDWEQFHSVKNLACALSVESSELLELFQWLRDEAADDVRNDPKLLSKVEDEVADIFVYLMRILSKTGIDLEAAVRQKMRKNAAKYPAEKARGKITKYNEL